MKDARSEAQKEIEEYRRQKDEEFKKFEAEVRRNVSVYGREDTRKAPELIYSQHSSGNKKAEEDAAKDAENKVKEIKEAGKEKGDKVVQELLRVVMDVRPERPDRVAAPPKS